MNAKTPEQLRGEIAKLNAQGKFDWIDFTTMTTPRGAERCLATTSR